MALIRPFLDVAFGTTEKMRRVLKYWLGTAVLYFVCACLVWHEMETGAISLAKGLSLIGLGVTGTVGFYILLRFSESLGLKNWHLAFGQAMFAIAYDLALYSVLTPIRGGILIGLPVIITFCAFSVRPQQTNWLSGLAIGSLALVAALLHHQNPITHPAYIEMVFFLQATIGIVSVTFVTSQLSNLRLRLSHQKDAVERAAERIQLIARTDELTNLANRRHMKDLLIEAEAVLTDPRQRVCVAVLDLDYFKSINDGYGHSAGDRVLQRFAAEAKTALRPCDTLARWGGEEFLLMMPNASLHDAAGVLERIAERIRELRLIEISEGLRISFSAGVVERERGEKLDDAIRRADRAMYTAKENGRAQTVVG